MWDDRTGRGVRVAVVDSGIHAGHPHVGAVRGGVVIGPEDLPSDGDWTDRLGHGTAVAGAIREKAPDAELHAVKVFDATLSTTADAVVRAIVWAADARMDLINLSLGTRRAQHAGPLAEAVRYATRRGALVIAAEQSDGNPWLPGSLPGVLAVRLDWGCPRDRVVVGAGLTGPCIQASGYARPIPGVSPESNLKGISFAVANVSGVAARVREIHRGATAAEVIAALRRSTLRNCERADRDPAARVQPGPDDRRGELDVVPSRPHSHAD